MKKSEREIEEIVDEILNILYPFLSFPNGMVGREVEEELKILISKKINKEANDE